MNACSVFFVVYFYHGFLREEGIVMSRKRIRKILSAALGLLAFGSSSGITKADDDVQVAERQNEDFFDGLGDVKDDLDDFGDDDMTNQAREDITKNVNGIREAMARHNSRFLQLSKDWTDKFGPGKIQVGETLSTSFSGINEMIKKGASLKAGIDRDLNDITLALSNPEGKYKAFGQLDAVGSRVDSFGVVVNQLEAAIADFENNLKLAADVDAQTNNNNRKANYNLLVAKRNEVGVLVKKVRASFKGFVDIKRREVKVDAISDELTEIRRQMEIKKEDGISNEEYDTISARLNEMKVTLADIARTIEEDKRVYEEETDHSVLTNMKLMVNQMYKSFSVDCNPRRLSAVGMSKDSVNQCVKFYNMVKEHYIKLSKEIQEKLEAAMDRVGSSVSSEIRDFCNDGIDKFNARIVSCKRAFARVQEFEANKQFQLSPAEYRQKARSQFINECRRIRDRGELTRAEKLDELVAAMSKILPGREAFHRQTLSLLDREVQIDARGNIDSTSVLAKNILFIGSPGNGKTEEVRTAADALGLKIIYANGDNFSSEAASNEFYNNLINETLNANSRFLIFFDEVDSIFVNRSLLDKGDQKGAVTVFNNFLSRLQRNPELMKKYAGLVGTTNMSVDRLDSALASRFQQRIHIPKFDEIDAQAFLRVELEPISIAANTTKEALIATLARTMVAVGMDARTALNIIDEVYAYSKSISPAAVVVEPSLGDDIDIDGNGDVIVMPADLIAGFNGMKLGGSKGRRNAVNNEEPNPPLRS